MKQKSFDAVRQKSRALAVLLCLAVLLLTGCGGGGAAAPEPPASAPAAGRTDEDTASSPAAPAPSEPESVSSSTAVSESEAQSPQEPEVEDFLRCEPMGYTSVSAVCSGQEGTLIVVKVRVENTTGQVVHAFNTSASLGNVTVNNAVDGMSADRVAAGKAAEHLTAVLRTTQETVVKKPVVAALESATEALQPGQSAVAYGYVFLPASEGSWTRADFLWKEQAIGSLTPKKKPQAPAESAAPSGSTAASAPSAKPEPPAASQPTASPGSPAGSEPSSQPETSAGSEHPAASEAPASPPASSAPSAPETPAASGTPASSEVQEPDTSAAFPEFTVLGQTLTPSGFCVHFRVKNHTKETLDLENTAAQFTDAADGTFREDRLYQSGTKSRWIASLCYLTNGAQTDEYPCYVVTSARSTVLKPGLRRRSGSTGTCRIRRRCLWSPCRSLPAAAAKRALSRTKMPCFWCRDGTARSVGRAAKNLKKIPRTGTFRPEADCLRAFLCPFQKHPGSFCRKGPQALTKQELFCILMKHWNNFPITGFMAGQRGPEK